MPLTGAYIPTSFKALRAKAHQVPPAPTHKGMSPPADRHADHPAGMPPLPTDMPTDKPTTLQACRSCLQSCRPTVSRALCAGTAQMTHLLAWTPLTKKQRQPLMRSDSCLCIRQITACYATSSMLAAACCHAAAARDVTRAQGPLSWHRARQGCAMGRACAGNYGAYFSLTLTTARFCPFMASSSYTSLAI